MEVDGRGGWENLGGDEEKKLKLGTGLLISEKHTNLTPVA